MDISYHAQNSTLRGKEGQASGPPERTFCTDWLNRLFSAFWISVSPFGNNIKA